MVRVFYDGKCGLCRREIEYYKRVAPQHVFEWVDITVDTDRLLQRNIPVQEALKVLHVQKDDGIICQGLDGFLVILENIPRFRWLSIIVRIEPLYTLMAFFYRTFANWRFNYLGYQKCDI